MTPAGVTPLLYDAVPGLVAFCPFTLVDHVPEKIDAFQVTVVPGNQFFLHHLGKLEGTLHDDIICL